MDIWQTERSEYERFCKAKASYATTPNSSEAIHEMMRLGLEGSGVIIRRWAGVWLKKNCNIEVLTDPVQEGKESATSSTPASFLR